MIVLRITDITYFQGNTLALREHSINYSSYVICLKSHPQGESSFSDIELSAAFSLTKEGLSERMSNGMNAYSSTPELKKKVLVQVQLASWCGNYSRNTIAFSWIRKPFDPEVCSLGFLWPGGSEDQVGSILARVGTLHMVLRADEVIFV